MQTFVATWDMKRNNYYWSNLIVYMIGCNCLIIMTIITLSKVIKHVHGNTSFIYAGFSWPNGLQRPEDSTDLSSPRLSCSQRLHRQNKRPGKDSINKTYKRDCPFDQTPFKDCQPFFQLNRVCFVEFINKTSYKYQNRFETF